MNHLQKYTNQVREHLLIILIANNAFLLAAWWYASHIQHMSDSATLILLIACASILVAGFVILSTKYLTSPLAAVWRAVLHIAPDTADTQAPNLQAVPLGKELVVSLVTQLYKIASVANDIEKIADKEQASLNHNFIAASLPLPLVVLNKDDTIIFANPALAKYIGQDKADVEGKNVYSVLDMAFTNEQTFDMWHRDARSNKAVAVQTWERVRLNIPDREQTDQPQFDLAAYYNRANPEGFETMLVLFDHTNQYAQDDQAMGFVALAVHELRTPLTLLRGYIEAFQEELSGKVDPELEDFMKKMAVAAGQLSTFVNTILNVSRIENNQLTLQLHKESWKDVLESAVIAMHARAEVRGINLEIAVDDNLPEVGVDRVSITEVINNLIDNAIKYSGSSDRIVIRSYQTKDGVVETTVQDFGVGVPENAAPHIFEKFYRNHRNRAQVGGTGLGLYLAKVIIGAHSGHIWVRSHEGEGSTFGFTVQPYNQVAAKAESSDNKSEIVRNAHGWIKNHSMYRR
jgi:signal transduction histidine kinase